jgi:hypothetical protein
MKLDDETKTLLHYLRGSDILWLADKLGRGDELLDRLRANMAEEDAATAPTTAPEPGADPSIVDDGNPDNGRELVQREPARTRRADHEPQAYELTFPDSPRLVMQAGPAYCARAAYEAFIEAGGEVNSRGFHLELRGESLDEQTARIERERIEARRAELAALRAKQKAEESGEGPPRLSDSIAAEGAAPIGD